MRKRHSKLQRQIFRFAALMVVLMVVLFGVAFSSIVFSMGIRSAVAVLRNKNQAAANLILGYFRPLRTALDFASGPATGIDHRLYRDPATARELRELYSIVQGMVPHINFVYSGYQDGSLLINNYTPPADFNAVARPWYQAALKAAPGISGGIPYQDILSGLWLVSFGRVLTDNSGSLIGVMAIDASMDSIVAALNVPDETYSTAYNFVMDKSGTILIHQRADLRDQSVSAVMQALSRSDRTSDYLEYNYDGESRIAYFTRLELLEWVVVTAVKKSAVFGPIYMIMAFSLGLIIVLTLVVAWFVSYLLSKHIIAPLNDLLMRVEKTSRGLDLPTVAYALPKNEIGVIARAIEDLTHEALYDKNVELRRTNEMLENLSRTDQLTGIANRRRTTQVLEQEIDRAERYKSGFCVLLFDIDLFKNVNDTYGHDIGDQVLVIVAELVESAIRKTETFGRWGGEEFLIVCPEAALSSALVVAEKVHAAIKSRRFPHGINITVSMGICEFRSGQTMQELLVEVDRKMYQAKQGGRNRTVY